MQLDDSQIELMKREEKIVSESAEKKLNFSNKSVFIDSSRK